MMERIRSFISIKIPETPEIEEVREDLKSIRGISVPNEVHMTLRFLGDVDADKVKELSLKMKALEKHPSFSISLKGLGAFPNTNDPRVVWIGADIGHPFKDLFAELVDILDDSSIDYDRKPFKAHVTVGRVRTASKPLTDLLENHKQTEFGSFVCSEVLLMSSLLTPHGAKHSIISKIDLS